MPFESDQILDFVIMRSAHVHYYPFVESEKLAHFLQSRVETFFLHGEKNVCNEECKKLRAVGESPQVGLVFETIQKRHPFFYFSNPNTV